jgi:succinoglycan biosynthesis transport protein ExoP
MSGSMTNLEPYIATPPFPQGPGNKSSGSPAMPFDLVGNLKRHWVMALSIFVVLMIIGAFVAVRMNKPTYYAESVVYVSPETPRVLTNDTGLNQSYDSYVEDEAHTVTRYDIIADAITKLPGSIRHRTGEALPEEVETLQKALEVTRVGSTYQVSIGLHGRRPENLAEVVNTITQTYLEKTNDADFYGRDARLKTLNDDEQHLRAEIDHKVAEQMQLMQDLGVATVAATEGASNPYDSELQKLKGELADARVQREAAEAALSAAVKSDATGGQSALDSAADDAIALDPGLASLRTTLNTRKATLMAEMNSLTPSHPVYKKDKDELAKIDAQLQQLTSEVRTKAANHIQQKLRSDVLRTRNFELQLDQQVTAKTQLANEAAPKIQRASELGSEIQELQTNSVAVDERIRDLQLESSSPRSIHLFSAARAPLGPEKSRLPFMLIGAFMGSLLVALASVTLDSHIYNASDVQRVVGFHPLGVLLNHDEFTPDIDEQYVFRLAAGIDQAIRTSGARTFLFTSVNPGSGTSTVVRKLGSELAGLDLRILTILASEEGTSMVYSSDSSDLTLEKKMGTSDLEETSSSKRALVSDGSHWRGSRTAQPASNGARVLQEAAAQYDVVLIDAQPLMISADTEYLARNADATVLIVESSRTKRGHLTRAARLLERLAVPGVSVVLNRVSVANADAPLRHSLHGYEQVSQRRRHSSIPERSLRTREAQARRNSETHEQDGQEQAFDAGTPSGRDSRAEGFDSRDGAR